MSGQILKRGAGFNILAPISQITAPFDVKSGEILYSTPRPKEDFMIREDLPTKGDTICCAASPDGKYIFEGCYAQDGDIQLRYYDIDNEQWNKPVMGMDFNAILDISISKDSDRIAIIVSTLESENSINRLLVYDMSQGIDALTLLYSYDVTEYTVRVRFNPIQNNVLLINTQNTLESHDITPSLYPEMPPIPINSTVIIPEIGNLKNFQYSTDGEIICVVSNDKSIQCFASNLLWLNTLSNNLNEAWREQGNDIFKFNDLYLFKQDDYYTLISDIDLMYNSELFNTLVVFLFDNASGSGIAFFSLEGLYAFPKGEETYLWAEKDFKYMCYRAGYENKMMLFKPSLELFSTLIEFSDQYLGIMDGNNTRFLTFPVSGNIGKNCYPLPQRVEYLKDTPTSEDVNIDTQVIVPLKDYKQGEDSMFYSIPYYPEIEWKVLAHFDDTSTVDSRGNSIIFDDGIPEIVNGKFGNAFRFRVSTSFSSTRMYIDTGLDFDIKNSKYTISFWADASNPFIAGGNMDAHLVVIKENIRYDFGVGINSSESGNFGVGTVADQIIDKGVQNGGDWVHVAFSFDNNNCDVYANGTLLVSFINLKTLSNPDGIFNTVHIGFYSSIGIFDEFTFTDKIVYKNNFVPPSKPFE